MSIAGACTVDIFPEVVAVSAFPDPQPPSCAGGQGPVAGSGGGIPTGQGRQLSAAAAGSSRSAQHMMPALPVRLARATPWIADPLLVPTALHVGLIGLVALAAPLRVTTDVQWCILSVFSMYCD